MISFLLWLSFLALFYAFRHLLMEMHRLEDRVYRLEKMLENPD